VASPHCRGFGDLLTSFLAINGTYERASRPCIPRTDRRHRGPLARYLERRRQLAQRVSAARITSPRGARTDGLSFLRWLGLSPSPIVSFATIPLESPRWVFPTSAMTRGGMSLTLRTPFVARHIGPWRWSPRRQCGSGQEADWNRPREGTTLGCSEAPSAVGTAPGIAGNVDVRRGANAAEWVTRQSGVGRLPQSASA
jgi:hypothetical protein